MSPELKMYYEGASIASIGVSINKTEGWTKVLLAEERKLRGLELRPKTEWISPNVREFIADKDLIVDLAKTGMTFKEIAGKWEVDRNTARKYLNQWGFESIKDSIPRYSLSDLYKGWADIYGEFIVTINKKPIFKVTRIS